MKWVADGAVRSFGLMAYFIECWWPKRSCTCRMSLRSKADAQLCGQKKFCDVAPGGPAGKAKLQRGFDSLAGRPEGLNPSARDCRCRKGGGVIPYQRPMGVSLEAGRNEIDLLKSGIRWCLRWSARSGSLFVRFEWQSRVNRRQRSPDGRESPAGSTRGWDRGGGRPSPPPRPWLRSWW